MNNTKPTITYIKNGKEKTVTISNNIIEKLIFTRLAENIDIPSKEEKTYSHKILPQVSLIHIKNHTFKEAVQFLSFAFLINGDESKNIILENCTFNHDIFLHHIKNIKIINPKFKNNSTIYISSMEGIENYSNIEIDLTNSEGELNLKIENCNKLNLISSNTLKKLSLVSLNTAIIENMNDTIVEILFDINKLTLKNSIIKQFIPSKDKIVSYNGYSLNYFEIVNLLELENSKLILPHDYEIKGDLEIKLKNSGIESSEYIKIPNVNFVEFNDDIEEESILDNSSYITAKELIINSYKYKSNILTIIDKKELTPTITYTKNNKEITFDIKDKYLDNTTYPVILFNQFINDYGIYLDKNIELIHFKNITFKDIIKINLYYNQVLILENCAFTTNFILRLNGGNIKIINVSFLNSYGFIEVANANSVFIDFTKEQVKDNINIETYHVKNCIVNYHNCLKHLKIDGKYTYLKNFNSLEEVELELNTNNLILENSTIPNDFNKYHPKTKVKRK